MAKIISFDKFRKATKVNKPEEEDDFLGETEEVGTENTSNVSSSPKKGWYFASFDDSDTAVILRSLGYLMGFVFFMVAIPVGFAPWVQRGLSFSFVSLGMSYLILLRKA